MVSVSFCMFIPSRKSLILIYPDIVDSFSCLNLKMIIHCMQFLYLQISIIIIVLVKQSAQPDLIGWPINSMPLYHVMHFKLFGGL